ncbi:podocan-like [Ciona intestinalis]
MKIFSQVTLFLCIAVLCTSPTTFGSRFKRGSRRQPVLFNRYICPPRCACSLNIIYCSGKQLNEIPSTLPRNGEFLHLENNFITRIRSGVFLHFPSIQRIILTKNRLISAGLKARSFEGLTALKRLDMSENKLTRFPRSLPPSLVELRLNLNNITKVKRGATRGLTNLVALSLFRNSITDAGFEPGTLKNMTSLSYLDLNENLLETVPQGLPESLREIRLENNGLKNVTAGIFTSQSLLHHFSLRNNQLSDQGVNFNAWSNMSNLFLLDLSYNKLRTIPRGLPSSLHQLIIENNFIEEINYETFTSTLNLTQIKLSFNKIRIITPGSFTRLIHLRFLDLAFNNLVYIPRGLPTTLEALFLESNHIFSVQIDSFCPMNPERFVTSKLHTLRLDDNLIDSNDLPALAFYCLSSMEVVVT